MNSFKKIDISFNAILLFLVLFITLWIAPNSYDIFTIPKNTLLKISLPILFIVIFFFVVFYKKQLFIDSLFLGLSFFLLTSAISTIFSLDRIISLWGSYERQIGLVGIFVMVVTFLSLQNTANKYSWKIFQCFLSIVIGILALGVLYQFFIDKASFFGLFKIATKELGLGSLLGHSNYLGHYLVVGLPLVFYPIYRYGYCFYSERKNKKIALFNTKHLLLFFLTIVFFILVLLATILIKSRGAWLTILMSPILAVFILFLTFYKNNHQNEKLVWINWLKWSFLTFLSLFSLILFVYLINVFSVLKTLPLFSRQVILFSTITIYCIVILFLCHKCYLSKVKIFFWLMFLLIIAIMIKELFLPQRRLDFNLFFDRMVSIFYPNTRGRYLIWQDSFVLLKEYWMRGTGLEMFRVANMPYRSLLQFISELPPDHPHNNFLYHLYTGGILHLFSYLAMIYLVYRRLLLALKEITASHLQKAKIIHLLVAFNAYLIFGQLTMDTFSMLLLLTSLIFIISIECKISQKNIFILNLPSLSFFAHKKNFAKIFLLFLIFSTFVVICLTIAKSNYNKMIANHSYKKAMLYQYYLVHKPLSDFSKNKMIQQVDDYFKKTITLDKHESFYQISYANFHLWQAKAKEDPREKKLHLNANLFWLNNALKHTWSPENIYLKIVQHHLVQHQYSLALLSAKSAEYYLPHSDELQECLGDIYTALKDKESALTHFKKSLRTIGRKRDKKRVKLINEKIKNL